MKRTPTLSKTKQRPRRDARAPLALCLAGALLLPGCYSRTVESRGLGTRYQGGQIHSPNLKSSAEGGGVLDGAGDLLIGPRTIEDRKR